MISDNLIDIQRRIDLALKESGRKPDSCTLIGVSKTKPVSLIREAFNSGLRDFGENYVEEFVLPSSGIKDNTFFKIHTS